MLLWLAVVMIGCILYVFAISYFLERSFSLDKLLSRAVFGVLLAFFILWLWDFAAKKALAKKSNNIQLYLGGYSKTVSFSIEPADFDRRLERVAAGLGARLVSRDNETFVFRKNGFCGLLSAEVISLSYLRDVQAIRVASRRCDWFPFDFGRNAINVNRVLDIMDTESSGCFY